ncbi:hypothetical protein LTR85_008994 [Meristemomyces frigidus]|nr:hypothetical protein LTR85_008994 [Meristemomyces frigidus]
MAARFFGVTELLKVVLLELSDRDLLLSQLVCRLFHDTINQSRKLQRKLSMIPDNHHPGVRLNSFVQAIAWKGWNNAATRNHLVKSISAVWRVDKLAHQIDYDDNGSPTGMLQDEVELELTLVAKVDGHAMLIQPHSTLFRMQLCQPSASLTVRITRASRDDIGKLGRTDSTRIGKSATIADVFEEVDKRILARGLDYLGDWSTQYFTME